MAVMSSSTKSGCCIFFLTSYLKCTTLATPLNAINSAANTAITVTNADHGALDTSPINISASLPPADFTISAFLPIRSTLLYQNDCFGITLLALYRLARAPLDSYTGGPEKFQKSRYKGVLLLLDGPDLQSSQAGPFNIKYMLWGLTLAIKHMVDRNEFRNWRFELKWQGNVVGSAWFMAPPQQASLDATGSPSATVQNITRAAPSILRLPGSGTNAGVSIRIAESPTGAVLYLNTIMMVIVGGLFDVAGRSQDASPEDYSFLTTFPPYRARFSLWAEPTPPGRPPYWLNYDLIMLSLLIVGESYIANERVQTYRPVGIELYVFGRLVGNGKLVEGSPTPRGVSGIAGGSANVGVA